MMCALAGQGGAGRGDAMFALVVLDGHLEAFDALVAETVAAIAEHEPGTVVYVSHARPDRPSERVFYECYRDEEAFGAHEATAHTRRFLAERTQHLSGDPEVWRLNTVEGQVNGEQLRGAGAAR